MSEVYGALAGMVVAAHFAYLVVLVFGGLAAFRWRRLLGLHVAAVAWALGAVTLRYDCPLTSLEEWLRRRAGQSPAPEGFLRHYVRGVLFPERLTPEVVVAAGVLVVMGWVSWLGAGGAALVPSGPGAASRRRPDGGWFRAGRSRRSGRGLRR